MGHLVESKAAAAESLEEEKENAEREETDEKVGEGGVNTRNSSITRSFSTPLLSVFFALCCMGGSEGDGDTDEVNLASVAFKETDVSDDFFLQNFLNSCKSAVK